MPAFTVQEIVDRAAAIADMDGNFVSPAQWLAWYNAESRALEFFIARSGWVHNTASSVDSSSGYEISIPEANRPMALIGVYEVRDGRYRPLKFQNTVDFTRQSYGAPATTGDAHFYSVESSPTQDKLTIYLFPLPSSGTYRVLYLAGREPVDDLTDSVNWPLGWEERIVLGMARRALIKEESDSRVIEKLMAEQDAIIEEFCWNRVLAESPRLRNVDSRDRGWSEDLIFGPYESWYWL